MSTLTPLEKLDLYDLELLKEPVNNVPSVDWVATNAGYGHMYHLKKYAGIPEETRMNCAIEHGFYTMYGAYINEIMHNISVILTFSDFRKEIIESRYDIKAVPIGPYIEYVEPLLSQEDVEITKKENGKTLLVMPAHYSKEETKQYDCEELFINLQKQEKLFNKIIVSLPIFDLARGVHSIFLEKGYDVVSVGSGGDTKYLRRLKTLIDCSDAVFANAFTTGLVYSVFMKKPVYLLKQKITVKKESNVLYRTRETNLVQYFSEVSNDCSYNNLDNQIKWGKKYAGFENIISKDDMRRILLANSKY